MTVRWQNSFGQFISLKDKAQAVSGDAKTQSPVRKIWSKFWDAADPHRKATGFTGLPSTYLPLTAGDAGGSQGPRALPVSRPHACSARIRYSQAGSSSVAPSITAPRGNQAPC